MSTQNEAPGQKGACQYYCSTKTGLCPEAGTAAGSDKLVTTDGSQTGSLLRYCWLKGGKTPSTRTGPWINSDL